MTQTVTRSRSGDGKSVTFELRIWWDPESEKIKMAAQDLFITTVNDRPASKRGHPKLFRKLARVLRDHGAPAPDIDPS